MTDEALPRAVEIRKLKTLRDQAFNDATDPRVVRLASELVRPYAADDYLSIAREVFRWVRDGIKYQRDPGLREEFASASTVIARGYDDCDGKVKVAVAMLRSLGVDGDFHPIWKHGNLVHVQLRVRWPGSHKVVGNQHGWVIGDVTIKGAELTQDPKSIASNAETGKLPLSGGSDPSALD